jgi:hypothetical protein
MKKIDEIIQLVREEMMTANAPSQSGGFSGSSPKEGPTAGVDPIISFPIRRKNNGKLDKRTPFIKKYEMLLKSLNLI